jgi:hypothetical protein
MNSQQEALKPKERDLAFIAILVGIVLVLFVGCGNMAKINERMDKEEKQCYLMKGTYDTNGECWIDEGGERRIVDLREGK